jgi:hypothetical protein
MLTKNLLVAKLREYKLPRSDQFLAELVQAGGETLLSVFYKLINSIWNKAELPDQWKRLVLYQFM